jgi:hypothetical protein
VFNKQLYSVDALDTLDSTSGGNMRFAPLAFLIALAACGNGPGTTGGDDDGTPDGNNTTPPDGSLPPPARGFQIISPPVNIVAGDQRTYCYYFKLKTTEAYAVNKWQSHMTTGSHHLILYMTTDLGGHTDGEVSESGCGGGVGANSGIWTYASQTIDQTETLPTDDGSGKPLAMNIVAGQTGFVQMHYLNASDQDAMVHIEINADALDAGAQFTQTSAYVTYNDQINIPATSTNVTASSTCNLPTNAKFWTMSTHSHKQSVATKIADGTSMVFSSTDWEHPGSVNWNTAPFYAFTNKLTISCTYDNPGSTAIVDGPSATTNEMCMAVGYYFLPSGTPSTKFCLASLAPNIF